MERLERLAIWEICGNHVRGLKDLLESLGLEKAFFRRRFTGDKVQVNYKTDTDLAFPDGFPGEEDFYFFRETPLAVRQRFTDIELLAANYDAGRNLYNDIREWTGELSKNALVRCVTSYPIEP